MSDSPTDQPVFLPQLNTQEYCSATTFKPSEEASVEDEIIDARSNTGKEYSQTTLEEHIKYEYTSGFKVVNKRENTHVLVFLTVLAMFTRYYKIGWSTKPTWDERTFYHDVHPPLGKLLIGLGGYLAGYDGTFNFTPTVFPPEVNYTAMRTFVATMGALIVPLAYLTACRLNMSHRASILAAWMVLLVISRLILLDPILLFFSALSLYLLASFHANQHRPFTKEWISTLFGLGISLGLELSVKWIGLFSIALVGLYTIEDLWEKFGQFNISKVNYLKHWLYRVFGLIVLPTSVYLVSFWIHFTILNRSGIDDGYMDSVFQARLKGSAIIGCPAELSYQSIVTIRSCALYGTLLHSSFDRYPSSSQEQQVSTFDRLHPENDWQLEVGLNPSISLNSHPHLKVKDGDLVRLRHVHTESYLRVHPGYNAILTPSGGYEVSTGIMHLDFGLDLWQIENVEDVIFGNIVPEIVQTVTSKFRLRNIKTGCLLVNSWQKYPEWGYFRNEVYCAKDPTQNSLETLWNIEFLRFPGAITPPEPKRTLPKSFLLDFVKLHFAMWSTNRRFVIDEDKYDRLSSKAWEWPILRRGIRLTGWLDSDQKLFLLGNPLVWWGSTLGILVYLTALVVYLIKGHRYPTESEIDGHRHFFFIGKILVVGWLLQYIPFYLMDRILYLHHYLPALYFACILAPYMLQHSLSASGTPEQYQNITFIIIGAIILLSYIHFSPLSFGVDGSISRFKYLAWLSTWHIEGPESAY